MILHPLPFPHCGFGIYPLAVVNFEVKLYCTGYVILALMSRQGPVSFIPFSLSPALLPRDVTPAWVML